MAPTSTLHLDLPIRSRGVRRALLTGISYRDLGARYPEFKLTSTWADVKHLQEFLKNTLDFKTEDIRVLTDEHDPEHSDYPNRDNLIQAMKNLVADTKEGDHLVFHFSGHGSQTPDLNGDEKDNKDEAIWPADVKPGEGLEDALDVIIDDEIKDILVDKVPAGAHLVIILDCCHSGTGADLPHSHRDHLAANVRRGLMHLASNNPFTAQKISLGGLTSTKSKTGATASPTSSIPESVPTDEMFSPITPPTALSPSSSSSSSSHSTSASSTFDWNPTAVSTPSPSTSVESLGDARHYSPPKLPVVVSWSACPDPHTTLSMADAGGYFISAFIDAFSEAKHATHEYLLHSIKERMQTSVERTVHKVVSNSPPPTNKPSAPPNYLELHAKRIEAKVWRNLEGKHQARPEPVLATNHDYQKMLETPVAKIFGASFASPAQNARIYLGDNPDGSGEAQDESH